MARLFEVKVTDSEKENAIIKIIPDKRKEIAMETEQSSPETKGVTIMHLAAIDLGPEIEGMAGRQLRMRMVTIEPGGVIGPIHNHIDRPGFK
ncbi:MAG TPA: hypothetical protein PKJ24_09050 [Prolixibacteraceae bacterium]|nr:hypothetical protein [Prolixibacteraceae bacterium]